MATRSLKVLKTLADKAFEPEKKTKKAVSSTKNLSIQMKGSFSMTITLRPSKSKIQITLSKE